MKILSNPNTEHVILQLLKDNNKQAFEIIYDKYSPPIFGMIKKQIPDDLASEEVLIRVFLNIWKNIDSFNPDSNRLFTWIYQFAVKEIHHTKQVR